MLLLIATTLTAGVAALIWAAFGRLEASVTLEECRRADRGPLTAAITGFGLLLYFALVRLQVRIAAGLGVSLTDWQSACLVSGFMFVFVVAGGTARFAQPGADRRKLPWFLLNAVGIWAAALLGSWLLGLWA